MFCRGIEYYDFWCTGTGKFLSYVILALVIYLLVQGYKAWKKWNEPRDMSGYSPATGTFSSGSEEPGELESEQGTDGTDPNKDDGELEEKDWDEDEEIDTSDEDFVIDLYDETVIFLANTGLTDMTYESLINEYFKLDTSNFPARIVDYDQNDDEVVFSLVLTTLEIVKFNIPMGDIEFYIDNTLQEQTMEVVFTRDFLETDFEVDDDLSLKENILGISWNREIFGEDNYSGITISISQKDYDSIFSK